uniref:DUF148 domain-containing protein n=1 Tax=Panagrellus redivivus TaxID=6233 RepID=A0A7E4V4H3_PANRE
MRLHGPGGWASLATGQLVWFCLVICAVITVCNAQTESAENSAGKNHLNGIRRLSIQKINGPQQILSNGAPRRYLSQNTRAKLSDSAEREREAAWPAFGHRGSGSTGRRAPFAVAPVMSSASAERIHSRDSGERESINYERRVNLLPVARGAMTHQASPPVRHRSSASTSAEHHIAEHRRLARWRKIGPLVGSGGTNVRQPYTRARYTAHAQHAPTVEVSTTTTERPTTTAAPTTVPTTTTRRVYTTRARPEYEGIPSSRPILPDTSRETTRPAKLTTEAPMIRRIHAHTMPHADGIEPPHIAARKAFGQRQLFNGPILDDNFEARTVAPPRHIGVSHSREDNDDGPTIVEEEQFAARSDGSAKPSNYPLAIPELTPLESRRPLPSFEAPGPFMARHRGDHSASNLKPLPPPMLPVFGEQVIQVEPPPPPRPPKLPSNTQWSGEEDFSETVTEGDGGGDSGLVGGGDSAAGFGSELGTPPPGFAEAFGLNGAGVDLQATMPPATTAAPTTTTTKAPTTTTRRPPPPPPPEEPFVIPENSGLRPVAPPSEFKGGFGSAKGSHLSGFSGGGGGFGGGGGGFGGGGGGGPPPPAPPPPAPKPAPKRGRMPAPDPNLTEEDYFTGESALAPNRAGPNGDGYGPPVFPGGAAPPPVPSVGIGGGAAGIPPYRMRGDDVENEPTTVKPSALLSMLNKADEGFNQAITHFEQGTPIEAAAIDILEVALGSTKLDSQAKLLSHVDRTIGLDNLQRLQRWANTGGAFDMVKEQFVKFAKNYKVPDPPPGLTIPPQLEYLFSPTG